MKLLFFGFKDQISPKFSPIPPFNVFNNRVSIRVTKFPYSDVYEFYHFPKKKHTQKHTYNKFIIK